MDVPIASSDRPLSRAWWVPLAILWAALAAGVAGTLWQAWRSDDALSHAPLVPIIAGYLLWSRRQDLVEWRSAAPGGLALLAVSALLHVAGSWADMAAIRQASLIGLLGGAVWYLGGWRALSASSAALGFLVFLIPWPTTVTEKLTFPMQLTSSSYAALISGLLGMPVVQSGVELATISPTTNKPIYQILVAAKCSGLTSLMVLLALGYLVACMTPLRFGWRALLLAAVVPLALVGNALRLTAVLAAGTYHSPRLATWVHDNEQPVLVLMCSIGLLALRHGMMTWTRPRAGGTEGPSGGSHEREPEEDAGAVPIVGG